MLTYLKTINGSFSSFTVDNLDNIYLVNTSGQLKKLNANGDSLAVFNDVKRYGAVSQIDVSNPLKILLYYKNFATIVTLDNYLNVRNTINLRKRNLYTVNCVATSYDNNIWLYDEQDYKLKKIGDDGSVLQESNDFRMIFDTVPSACQITDHENFVYLYDSIRGFYSFDYYGNFKNHLPFLHWNSTAVTGKILYGFSNNKLMSYLQQSLNLKEYVLPAFTNNYLAIKIMNNKLYVLKAEGLSIYQVK
ncbi:MAG: hypothetical protein JST86_02835 [Bacteroidetes bacterium]|nr:hypothetical protein [Bacteroidota bacterium]